MQIADRAFRGEDGFDFLWMTYRYIYESLGSWGLVSRLHPPYRRFAYKIPRMPSGLHYLEHTQNLGKRVAFPLSAASRQCVMEFDKRFSNDEELEPKPSVKDPDRATLEP